jgi:uncharacterized lipoprotein YajG
MRVFFLIMVMTLIGFSAKAQNKAALGTIVNNIKAGPLTGNKNLAFGVKNILQEALQDKGLTLVDRFDADYVIDVEIFFFDVEQTKQGVSVFHQDKNEVVVRMKGTLSDGFGKVLKNISTEDRSSEISTSTLLINEGGQFNSAVQRNAVKKACVSVVSKLF